MSFTCSEKLVNKELVGLSNETLNRDSYAVRALMSLPSFAFHVWSSQYAPYSENQSNIRLCPKLNLDLGLTYQLTCTISTSKNVQSPFVIPKSYAASINFLTNHPRTLRITTWNRNIIIKTIFFVFSKENLLFSFLAYIKLPLAYLLASCRYDSQEASSLPSNSRKNFKTPSFLNPLSRFLPKTQNESFFLNKNCCFFSLNKVSLVQRGGAVDFSSH